MIPPPPHELRQFADVLQPWTGGAMTVRFVEPGDIEQLRRYFGELSSQSHYNRFLGATRGVPASEFARMLRTGEAHHFAVLVELDAGDARTVIGEARYVLDPTARTVEVGISVADSWHGYGVGSALLANLECRAAAIGADVIFGDALPANRKMLGLARSRGYRLSHPPGDWKLVRFSKDVPIAQNVPCARSSRAVPLLAAAG